MGGEGRESFSHAEVGTQKFEVVLTRVLEVLAMLEGGTHIVSIPLKETGA